MPVDEFDGLVLEADGRGVLGLLGGGLHRLEQLRGVGPAQPCHVLDAAVVLKKRGVTGIRLVFIGDGKLRPALMARAQAEGLDELVSWVGLLPKEELARVLPSMDVGMMILKNVPAFYKGTSPNKFFDYISCGLPVLNNYPGWLADHITASRCGVVVPPDDPEAFADTVMTLVQKRGELSEMGRRSRELAEREFARDLLAEGFVTVLKRVYEQSQQARPC